MSIKLLIIEDHDDFRDIVKTHIQKQDSTIQIFEASSGESGVALALEEKPDIILMDIRLQGMNGIEASSKIKHFLPRCEIIVLTMFETENFKKIFKSDDITAYIGKSELYEKLIPTIKRFLSKRNNSSS